MGKGDKRSAKRKPGPRTPSGQLSRSKAALAERQRVEYHRGPQIFAKDGNACIYAVEAVGTNFVKIGVAKAPIARMKSLQTGCPHELRLLYVCEAPERVAFKIERAIHKSPEAMNSHAQGEWIDMHHQVLPFLFAAAAERFATELVWRAGAPNEIEPDDFKQSISPSFSGPTEKVFRRNWRNCGVVAK